MHFIKTNNLLERRNYEKVRNLIANDQTETGNENRFLRLTSHSYCNKTTMHETTKSITKPYGGRNKTKTNMIYSCLNIVEMT